jgi:hypothetical protein
LALSAGGGSKFKQFFTGKPKPEKGKHHRDHADDEGDLSDLFALMADLGDDSDSNSREYVKLALNWQCEGATLAVHTSPCDADESTGAQKHKRGSARLDAAVDVYGAELLQAEMAVLSGSVEIRGGDSAKIAVQLTEFNVRDCDSRSHFPTILSRGMGDQFGGYESPLLQLTFEQNGADGATLDLNLRLEALTIVYSRHLLDSLFSHFLTAEVG